MIVIIPHGTSNVCSILNLPRKTGGAGPDSDAAGGIQRVDQAHRAWHRHRSTEVSAYL